MKGSIFLAGAAGAVGRPLCRLLAADGWQVHGTTRSPARAEALPAMGVKPAIVDVYDAEALDKFERQVLDGPFTGIVLRYGHFYGPGTGFERRTEKGAVHVDAAADAARRAVTGGSAGIYVVAEDDGPISSERAKTELGWKPAFRL